MPGKYKGICIKNKPLMNGFEPFSVSSDKVTKIMDFILHWAKQPGAIIFNSYDCNNICVKLMIWI